MRLLSQTWYILNFIGFLTCITWFMALLGSMAVSIKKNTEEPFFNVLSFSIPIGGKIIFLIVLCNIIFIVFRVGY